MTRQPAAPAGPGGHPGPRLGLGRPRTRPYEGRADRTCGSRANRGRFLGVATLAMDLGGRRPVARRWLPVGRGFRRAARRRGRRRRLRRPDRRRSRLQDRADLGDDALAALPPRRHRRPRPVRRARCRPLPAVARRGPPPDAGRRALAAGRADTGGVAPPGDIVAVPPVRQPAARNSSSPGRCSAASSRTGSRGRTARPPRPMRSPGARAFAPPCPIPLRWVCAARAAVYRGPVPGPSPNRVCTCLATEAGPAPPPPRSSASAVPPAKPPVRSRIIRFGQLLAEERRLGGVNGR